MAFKFSKRKRLGKTTSLNIGKKGVSISKKMGPLTVSSRGNSSLRIMKGVSRRKKLF